MDDTIPVRSDEHLNEIGLAAYLRGKLPGSDSALSVRQFGGGAANLTYLLDYGTQEYVLRRPPLGPVAAPAAQPRPVVTGSSVRVQLASEPAGATVRRKADGAPLGRTPLEVTLAPQEEAVDVVVEAPEHTPQIVTVRRDSPPTSVRLVAVARRRAPAPRPAAPTSPANTGPLDDKDLGSW